MDYDEAFLEKVRAFGVLGYPSHEIIYLVDPEDPIQFEKDISDKDNELYKAFQKGKMTGQYAMDKSLFDAAKANNIEANQKLKERQYLKKIDAAIYQHFNL